MKTAATELARVVVVSHTEWNPRRFGTANPCVAAIARYSAERGILRANVRAYRDYMWNLAGNAAA